MCSNGVQAEDVKTDLIEFIAGMDGARLTELYATLVSDDGPHHAKRKRDSRGAVKDELRSPGAVDADRIEPCSCDKNCCMVLTLGKKCRNHMFQSPLDFLAAESHASLRNTLFKMTQSEEADWRRPFLKQHALSERSPRTLNFNGKEMCLKGFAIVAGGSSYIRTCFRDLATLQNADDFGNIATTEKEQLRRSIVSETHSSAALRSYLLELLNQIADVCPVTGKVNLTVSSY